MRCLEADVFICLFVLKIDFSDEEKSSGVVVVDWNGEMVEKMLWRVDFLRLGGDGGGGGGCRLFMTTLPVVMLKKGISLA